MWKETLSLRESNTIPPSPWPAMSLLSTYCDLTLCLCKYVSVNKYYYYYYTRLNKL